ncbi:hypothetical protein AQUCO_03400199v1 [Aquilegia coerulea]|uniref:Fe2OG dioxygenase domain-containing protein n=1 Tax=Aquilegia coerulea TaxID=218851 RepID=A0A2G5CXW3_AQUCA|nr:hypothetical protein AQUCO_03400199v1 [Aquilegia coerulea]
MAIVSAPFGKEYCDEWVKQAKEYDQSKMGVKGLLDSGVTTIPSIFTHPSEDLNDLKPSSRNLEIPIIDLSMMINDRLKIAHQIKESFSSWGFFQVINHGIPIQVIEETIKAFKCFHEEPMIKDRYVWDEKVSYYSNFNIFKSKAVNWKDSLRVLTSPNPPEKETIPNVCRKELMAWDEYMKSLCETLMELMCEGLGVSSNRLKELSCLQMRKLLCHSYPYCPQPDLTMGLPTHTDRGLLTLLLQNEVSGLQVKYDDEWVEVKPIPGAIIVNVGDLLQSVEHRVLANPYKEPRISVAVIFNPGKCDESDYYGPLPELLSQENPGLYRNFTIPEILGHEQTDNCVKIIVDLCKISGQGIEEIAN